MAASRCVLSGREIKPGDVVILIEAPKQGKALLSEATSEAHNAAVRRLEPTATPTPYFAGSPRPAAEPSA